MVLFMLQCFKASSKLVSVMAVFEVIAFNLLNRLLFDVHIVEIKCVVLFGDSW